MPGKAKTSHQVKARLHMNVDSDCVIDEHLNECALRQTACAHDVCIALALAFVNHVLIANGNPNSWITKAWNLGYMPREANTSQQGKEPW